MISPPGMRVPINPPHLLISPAMVTPRKLNSVAAQYVAREIITTYVLFADIAWSQRWFGPTNASETAAKVSTVGNQIVLSTHCRKIATKPQRGPNASPTQRNTPPFCGHPVANSAATSDTG